MNLTIRPETPADLDAIDDVIHLAFGRMDEAHLVRNLRSSGALLLSLVAEGSSGIVGHIAFSRMFIETANAEVPAVSLAPLAVRPELQRQGIGGMLTKEGLNWLARQDESVVIVLGSTEYYPRFGFSSQLAQSIHHPFGATTAWMALELRQGTLASVNGRAKYSSAFGLPSEWTWSH